MPIIDISDALHARLQSIATPLVDTHETVIARLLDHWNDTQTRAPRIMTAGAPLRLLDDGTMEFAPGNPPDLRFTTCLQIRIGEKLLLKGDTSWNGLMLALVRQIFAVTKSAEVVLSSLAINAQLGQRDDSGYKYLPDVGISVQGQDSNAAFRQAYAIAALYGLKFQIWFQWQQNERAAYPNHRGLFEF